MTPRRESFASVLSEHREGQAALSRAAAKGKLLPTGMRIRKGEMIDQETFAKWQDWSKQDDACRRFVPGDIRQMLGDIVRLRSTLEYLLGSINFKDAAMTSADDANMRIAMDRFIHAIQRAEDILASTEAAP